MDTHEINKALRGRVGPFINYKGVFTSNNLPWIPYSQKPTVLIANTQSSSDPIHLVGHWVVFYLSYSPTPSVLFFDSYGLSPHFYSLHFSRWLSLYSKFKILEFGRQIQPDDSQKCGLYVLHFTHYVSHWGLERYKTFFQNQFSFQHLHLNDRVVTRYFFTRLVKNNNNSNNACSQWKKYKSSKQHALTFSDCLKYRKR